MSSAAIPPASIPSAAFHPARGATALGPDSVRGAASAPGHRHLLGDAVRAVKVFGKAAFSVAVLGEYADDVPGVRQADRRAGRRTSH
ncbi:hypothetical protein SSP35_01_01440 [Streptomyces sp. NBRC 110611]|uniref:hypothetical protein n=1 Tax=Streptomyces sp. NBRC 110611 TaxID=1621259 RepID=UPI00083702F2|nr:hypothetical protein [Streptomyces sp. NBRC 110611]GAU64808.1 hypothetical protein SSP35_01_01440 [Streptomyces sp. NBRC 110611]